MPDWTPDPIVPKFKPDEELLARAQRHMKAEEGDASARQIRVRQTWEHALAATRVALDSMREIYPTEIDCLPTDAQVSARDALDAIEEAYASLDAMSEALLGEVMTNVLAGAITSHEALDEMGVPR